MSGNILLVGVGGQGTILAAKLLTLGLVQAGYDVRMSEIHGMSQRGGSVVSHIRYSEDRVYSPVIEKGTADVVVAFEQMEAVRYLDYLNKDGQMIVSTQKIASIPIAIGAASYPNGLGEYLNSIAKVTFVDAYGQALKLGKAKVSNLLLLGVTIGKLQLESIDWDGIMEKTVRPEYVEINKKALTLGIQLAK